MTERENAHTADPISVRIPRGSILKHSTRASKDASLLPEKTLLPRDLPIDPHSHDFAHGESEFEDEELLDYDETSLTEVVIPPDGGWGWVIVCASFFSGLIVDGIIYSFGFLIEPIQKALGDGTKKSTINWVGSITTGVYLLVGPIVAALANRYGFRMVAITGSIISAVGFALAYVFCRTTPNMPALYACYGILGGIGLGFIYMPAVVAVGFYFDKKRALATGIALCGSGIGTFIFPPLIQAINVFGWQWSLVFSAAVILLCAPLGLAYRPLKPTIVYRENCRTEVVNRSSFAGVPFVMNVLVASPEHDEGFEENMERPERRKSHVTYISDDNNIFEGLNKGQRRQSIVLSRRKSTVASLYRSSLDENEGDVQAPLVQTEGEAASSIVTATPASFPTIDNRRDSDEERDIVVVRRKGPWCPYKCFDCSLMRSPTYILVLISGFFDMVGLFVPFIYLKSFAEKTLTDKTMTDTQKQEVSSHATFLISIIGIGNCIGRVAGGWIADLPKVNDLLLSNTSITIMGACTLVVPWLGSYAEFIVYSLTFGISMGCMAALRPSLLTDLLGLEKLTNAFGLSLVVLGIACIVGSPFLGLLQEMSDSMKVPFYVGGSCILFAAAINYPLFCVKRWEDRRAEGNATAAGKKPGNVPNPIEHNQLNNKK